MKALKYTSLLVKALLFPAGLMAGNPDYSDSRGLNHFEMLNRGPGASRCYLSPDKKLFNGTPGSDRLEFPESEPGDSASSNTHYL